MQTRNRLKNRKTKLTLAAAFALGGGFVLMAQNSGRADQFADPTDRELKPMWSPGTAVPMATYLGADIGVPLAPPR